MVSRRLDVLKCGFAALREACCLCLDDHAKLVSFNRKDLDALVMFRFFLW